MAAPEDNLDEFRARLAELRVELAPPSEPGSFLANTDGACIGNPGFGGWGTLVETPDFASRWELFGHLARTTNNRAEALAVLAAFEWLPAGSALALRSDSELTLNILRGQYKVKANPDIWAEIFSVRTAKKLDVQLEWVRGHAGDVGNERADYLSRLGASGGDVARAESYGRVPTLATPKKPTEVDGLVGSTPWEKDFLKSVADQLRKGRTLSDKQQAI